MYIIPYEKCVCFIFLVILAVLSCSGFRIDNLAMTDISKRNSFTSNSLTSSDEFFHRIFNVNSTQSVTVPPTYRHRIRHHRQLRAQAHHRHFEQERSPSGRIDVRVIPRDGLPPTVQPSEHLPQIPSTEILYPLNPTVPIITRSQRSPNQRNQRIKKQHPCQDQDITRKAYLAKIVVRAKVESMESGENYTVCFRVIKQLKNSSHPVDQQINLKFSRGNPPSPCEPHRMPNRPPHLVRANIRQSKEYLLFLDMSSVHNYTAIAAPELIRREKIPKSVTTITNRNFVAKPTQIKSLEVPKSESREESRKRLKLVCKTKGLPTPYISWKQNGVPLRPNNQTRILYTKRRSTLIIKYPSRRRITYTCIAQGVDGRTDTKDYIFDDNVSKTVGNNLNQSWPDDSGVPCNSTEKEYCANGECRQLPLLSGMRYCICNKGYKGDRCLIKDEPRTYMPTSPSFACKLGLQTKYNC